MHTVAAFAAMLFGAIVLLRTKGGASHRRWGYAYAASMGVMLITSFAMYGLTGGFNVLHVAAIASSLTLAIGLRYAIIRRPRNLWYALHYRWMSWSYVGLLAAFVAESATRLAMPYLDARFEDFSRGLFWLLVGLASATVVALGGRQIRRNAPNSPRS